jgi:imidazolonepropionase-like amidohydrolase
MSLKLFCSFFVFHCFFLPAIAQDYSTHVEPFIVVQSGNVALTHVKIIDGTGGEVITDQTIILKNNRIAAIGPSSELQAPPSSIIIDGKGKTVIPGLVMLHEHMFYSKPFEGQFSVGQMSFTFPRLYLAGGATTIRTGGSVQPQSDLNIKKWIDNGKMAGPKIDVTGPFITREGFDILELGNIVSSEQAGKTVRFWSDMGSTSFKVYTHVTRDDLKAIVDNAHSRGAKVTGHLCSVTYREAAEIGIDNLEHGFMASNDFNPDKVVDICDPFGMSSSLYKEDIHSEKMKALITFLVEKKVAITSTLPVFEPYTAREIVPGGGLESLAPQIREKVTEIYNSRIGRDSLSLLMFKKEMAWEKQFYDAGGLLVVGTDPTGAGRVVPGYANQHTIELLAEAGFNIGEAIKIATLHGAQYLDQSLEIGTIQVGKIADLVLINGDLESDVSMIREMEIIFKDGVGYDSQKLFNSVKGQVGLY